MAFWKMLKQGYDHFEVARLEPKVSVCDRRYVFDAEQPTGAKQPLRFDPTGRCPAYEVNQELREAVAEKQHNDDTQFAALVQKGTATVPVVTGRDGGMHPSFLAKLSPHLVRDPDGTARYDIDPTQAAKLGSYVNPPRAEPASTGSVAASTSSTSSTSRVSLASAESKPVSQSVAPESDGAFSRFSRWMGLSSEPKQEQAKPVPAPKPSPATRTAGAPQPKPKSQPAAAAEEPIRTTAATPNPAMNGAAPMVASDSFESRFGPTR